MELNYKTFGSGFPLIIMHGLLGSLDNWQTLAKQYAENHTVFIIDLRNHGKSPHTAKMNYSLMVEDLYHFMEQNHIYESHILGHSMGGKVAMQFALEHPDMVSKLIIADIAPIEYKPGHETIFKALMEVDLSTQKTREEIDTILEKDIPEYGIRQFLMKGLTRDEDKQFVWKFNLNTLWKDYYEILSSFTSAESFDGQALFIRGEKSNYVKEEYLERIEMFFPNYQLETIAGAGHWLHAEKPKKFFTATQDFLLN